MNWSVARAASSRHDGLAEGEDALAGGVGVDEVALPVATAEVASDEAEAHPDLDAVPAKLDHEDDAAAGPHRRESRQHLVGAEGAPVRQHYRVHLCLLPKLGTKKSQTKTMNRPYSNIAKRHQSFDPISLPVWYQLFNSAQEGRNPLVSSKPEDEGDAQHENH